MTIYYQRPVKRSSSKKGLARDAEKKHSHPTASGALLPLHQREDTELLSQIAKYTTTPARPLSAHGRPLVGIPMNATLGLHFKWPLQAADGRVVQAIIDAGGTPVPFVCHPIPTHEHPFWALWQALRRFDALVLPGGGGDVDPRWHGIGRHPQTIAPTSQWEDWWNVHSAALATLLRIPLLGICLGAQYWNIALGGSLYQDLRTEYPGGIRHRAPGRTTPNSFVSNTIYVLPIDSIFAGSAENAREVPGDCRHHQGLKKIAPDLVVTAKALDGLPEVIERTDAFGIGTQFHPEVSTQRYARNLFERLMEAGRTYASSQRESLEDCSTAIAKYLYSSPPYPRLTLASPLTAFRITKDDQEDGSQVAPPIEMPTKRTSQLLPSSHTQEGEREYVLSTLNHS